MLCTTTVSSSRTKESNASSWGLWTFLPDADLINRDGLKLPLRVLIERNHPDIADAMTRHIASES
jgi:hypothetical protein